MKVFQKKSLNMKSMLKGV